MTKVFSDTVDLLLTKNLLPKLAYLINDYILHFQSQNFVNIKNATLPAINFTNHYYAKISDTAFPYVNGQRQTTTFPVYTNYKALSGAPNVNSLIADFHLYYFDKQEENLTTKIKTSGIEISNATANNGNGYFRIINNTEHTPRIKSIYFNNQNVFVYRNKSFRFGLANINDTCYLNKLPADKFLNDYIVFSYSNNTYYIPKKFFSICAIVKIKDSTKQLLQNPNFKFSAEIGIKLESGGTSKFEDYINADVIKITFNEADFINNSNFFTFEDNIYLIFDFSSHSNFSNLISEYLKRQPLFLNGYNNSTLSLTFNLLIDNLKLIFKNVAPNTVFTIEGITSYPQNIFQNITTNNRKDFMEKLNYLQFIFTQAQNPATTYISDDKMTSISNTIVTQNQNLVNKAIKYCATNNEQLFLVQTGCGCDNSGHTTYTCTCDNANYGAFCVNCDAVNNQINNLEQ